MNDQHSLISKIDVLQHNKVELNVRAQQLEKKLRMTRDAIVAISREEQELSEHFSVGELERPSYTSVEPTSLLNDDPYSQPQHQFNNQPQHQFNNQPPQPITGASTRSVNGPQSRTQTPSLGIRRVKH